MQGAAGPTGAQGLTGPEGPQVRLLIQKYPKSISWVIDVNSDVVCEEFKRIVM